MRSRRSGRTDRRAHGPPHPSLCEHRRDVLQSGDRRARQGPPGARDRRARRTDGASGGRGRHSVPPSQPLQRPGRSGPARTGRSDVVPARHAAGNPGDPQPRGHRRQRGGAGAAGRGRRRNSRRRRAGGARRCGCADDRHVSAWRDPPRRRDATRRPAWRSAGRCPLRLPFGPGPAARASQDRHAGAARRAHDRLGGPRHAAGR